MSETKVVVLDATSAVEEVKRVLALSCLIFEIDVNDSTVPLVPPADIKQWLDRLNNHGGEVVYQADEVSDEPLALAFTYERVPSVVNSTSNDRQTSPEVSERSLHVWIAGCHPLHRRKGLMDGLFDFIEARAQQRGYTALTVNTYPARFVNMPQFLVSERRGFHLIKSTFQVEGDHTVEKQSYKKSLI